jgi:UDP-4-amino-4,6-dideoxy-N-acetyl-beta-L-altrosamine N-acetyltransferase
VPEYSLRPLVRDDLEMVLAWRNSGRVRAVMFTDQPISWEEHLAWFERAERDTARFYDVFEIDGRPVGVTGITELDRLNGTASFGLYLGETDVPGGSGSRMTYLTLRWAFDDLGVRKLGCEALDFNERAIAMYRKCGLSQEGLLRKHCLKGDEYRDMVVFGMLREEWEEIRPRLSLELFGPAG